jgi:hypothetical protein
MPSRDEWQALFAGAVRDAAPKAEVYIRSFGSYSKPVVVSCDDGNDYVLKGRQIGRAVPNDQIIARLGHQITAPVGEPAFVMVTDEMIAAEREMSHMPAGLCHATKWIPDCSDRLWLEHATTVENKPRFLKLAVLYGWIRASDHQVIYASQIPYLVHSVDHGHHFPGGPEWTVASLQQAPSVDVETQITSHCGHSLSEIEDAVTDLLDRTSDDGIANAIGIIPDEWGLSPDEKVALATYLSDRRIELMHKYSRAGDTNA